VARNRRRAAERKGRQRPEEGNGAPEPNERLHRADQPGSLDHASGEVDEFEAAIVAGADGLADVEDDPAKQFDTISEEELLEEEPDAATEAFGATPRKSSRGRGERPSPAQPAGHGGGNRLIGFFRACWAELQRVQWPDRRQVGQATAVVIGFVIIAGAYLGLADAVAQKVINFIL
jgi:preprotein translocase subunit SecE